jgi:hypothetical protein
VRQDTKYRLWRPRKKKETINMEAELPLKPCEKKRGVERRKGKAGDGGEVVARSLQFGSLLVWFEGPRLWPLCCAVQKVS